MKYVINIIISSSVALIAGIFISLAGLWYAYAHSMSHSSTPEWYLPASKFCWWPFRFLANQGLFDSDDLFLSIIVSMISWWIILSLGLFVSVVGIGSLPAKKKAQQKLGPDL